VLNETIWPELHTPVPRNAAVATASARAPWAPWLHPLLREPLFHFFIIGLAIFALAHWLEARSTRYVITIGPAEIARIKTSYTQQYGTPPDATQMRKMIDGSIREEIYLREGLALGLDRNDEIVRRRIAQKYQFLQADMATARQPSDSELLGWFAAHRADFTLPATRSFDQIYYAIDRRGEAAAKALATTAAARLAHGQPPPAADDFPGPRSVTRLGQDDVDRLFGGQGFAAAVFAAPTGRWVGPLRSGFGWHLVRVTATAPAHSRDFDAAHDDALRAWQEQDRADRDAAAYQHLLAHYTVRRADQP